jgi:hypothetical protein
MDWNGRLEAHARRRGQNTGLTLRGQLLRQRLIGCGERIDIPLRDGETAAHYVDRVHEVASIVAVAVYAQCVAEFVRSGTFDIVHLVECDTNRHIRSKQSALSEMRPGQSAIQVRIKPNKDVGLVRLLDDAISDEPARRANPAVESGL